MSLDTPKCYKRGCKHLDTVKNDGDESTERWVCDAFPDGIPNRVAYGENKHIKPLKSDHGIQFEPIKKK